MAADPYDDSSKLPSKAHALRREEPPTQRPQLFPSLYTSPRMASGRGNRNGGHPRTREARHVCVCCMPFKARRPPSFGSGHLFGGRYTRNGAPGPKCKRTVWTTARDAGRAATTARATPGPLTKFKLGWVHMRRPTTPPSLSLKEDAPDVRRPATGDRDPATTRRTAEGRRPATDKRPPTEGDRPQATDDRRRPTTDVDTRRMTADDRATGRPTTHPGTSPNRPTQMPMPTTPPTPWNALDPRAPLRFWRTTPRSRARVAAGQTLRTTRSVPESVWSAPKTWPDPAS